MHTAPVYDQLTEPKRVPLPSACIESKAKGCKCYTQDATDYPVDLAMCRRLVAHGMFIPFAQEQRDGGEREPKAPPPSPVAQAESIASPVLIADATGKAAPPVAAPEPQQPQRVGSFRR
jgi:zona occludens toxin